MYTTIKGHFMENKSIKNLKYSIFLVLLMAIFQSCSAQPATAITDANQMQLNTKTNTYKSGDPILGNVGLTISNISELSMDISFNGISDKITLSNYGGQNGTYMYESGNMTASVRLSDETSVTVSIYCLDSDLNFSLENIICDLNGTP